MKSKHNLGDNRNFIAFNSIFGVGFRVVSLSPIHIEPAMFHDLTDAGRHTILMFQSKHYKTKFLEV